MSKQRLFSVTKKDLRVQFFRAGGSGGQNQNKVSSACRIKHLDSGAVGECRNFRHQYQNKREALKRLVNSKKFQVWVKVKASGAVKTTEDIKQEVDKMMHPRNLKIEYLGECSEM